ncbi:MAG: hypothetical protein IKN43_11470 [Selenomonadaceae bacterium]|nr:hypothetical protein [Selenomonadaceae bacterium]
MNGKSNGFMYVEALFACGIILVLFVATALLGGKIFANVAAEYEAVKLVSDLRYVQEINRNSYFPRDGVFDSIKPKNNTYFAVKFYRNRYEIEPTAPGTHKTIIHRAMSNVAYTPKSNVSENVSTSIFKSGVLFLRSGDVRQVGHILIESSFAGAKAKRYVIIDKSGRVRMDRNPP